MHLDSDINEILATRAKPAESSGVPLTKVSQIMGELAGINAIGELKEGRTVRYFLDPWVGTYIDTPERRELARALFGPLRLTAPLAG